MPDRDLDQRFTEIREDRDGRYRLHFNVPRPAARVNLGMPWFQRLAGTDFSSPSIPKFGYRGISLQSEYHLYADIQKYTLIHTAKSTQIQTGKDWLQYTSGSQWIAAGGDATLASSKRLTIVAGAGQEARRPIDHGMDPRLDPYNNLNLHYTVDAVMMGVCEFLNGRRRRERHGLGPFGKWEFSHRQSYVAQRNSEESPNAAAGEIEGFYDIVKRAPMLLGLGLPNLEGLKKFFPDREKADERFGYGKRYFSSFDPYEIKDISAASNGVSAVLIALKNATAMGRRFADVASRIGEAFMNLPLIRQASQLGESAEKIEDIVVNMEAQYRRYDPDRAGGAAAVGDGSDVSMDDSIWNQLERAGDRLHPGFRRAEIILTPPSGGDWTPGFLGIATEEGAASIESVTNAAGSRLTSPQVVEALNAVQGIEAEILEDGRIVVRSTELVQTGPDQSYLRLSGPFLEENGLASPQHSRVPRADLEATDDLSGVIGSYNTCFSALKDIVGLRPLTDHLQAAAQNAEAVVKMLDEVAGMFSSEAQIPSPPSAVGIFAKDGISLGTTDRFVSAAGKGYVFIADGGTGQRDTARFVPPGEHVLAQMVETDDGIIDQLSPDESTGVPPAERSGEGGFTVLSNSNAAVITRNNLDLLALGSACDESEDVHPRGVARLAATRSVEVSAHNRVTIAATAGPFSASASDDVTSASDTNQGSDFTFSETGQVEVLGKAIRIGSAVARHDLSELVDEIPWPSEQANTTRAVSFKERRYASRTDSVEIRTFDRTSIALGSGVDDVEAAERRVERWRLEEDRIRVELSRIEAELTRLTAASPSDEQAQRRRENLKIRYNEANVEHARALERWHDAQMAAGEIRDTGDDLVATQEMIRDEIRIGFRRRETGTWGPHLFITPDCIKLMCGDSSEVQVVVNDRHSRMQGTGAGSYVECGATVRAPGVNASE